MKIVVKMLQISHDLKPCVIIILFSYHKINMGLITDVTQSKMMLINVYVRSREMLWPRSSVRTCPVALEQRSRDPKTR